MAPPVHQKVELEEEKDLLYKCKRPKFSGSIVQSQQEIEVPAMEKENKGHGVVSLEVSVDKKPMDGVTDYVVLSTVGGNSFSKGVHGSASKKPAARSRLNTICSAIGWKDPSYEFEEQGPPHNKLFTCKVTVYVDTITSTVVESLREPKRQKKAALEQAHYKKQGKIRGLLKAHYKYLASTYFVATDPAWHPVTKIMLEALLENIKLELHKINNKALSLIHGHLQKTVQH